MTPKVIFKTKHTCKIMKLIFFSIIAFSMIGLIFPSGIAEVFIDEMLEGQEREKQKGSAHTFRKFPYGMGHEQYNLLKKIVKILTS